MEPVSALVIALASAYAITYGVVDGAREQAAQEARAAAEAIRAHLRDRSEAWAQTLADRIADGRAGGPATAMWWAWAAARTGRALRGALRREPREAERARAIRGETGPWRRIYDAGVNGARFAREQARQQRRAQERPSRVRLGVCEQCGAVVAAESLDAAAVGPARRVLRVCVACRAAEATKPDTGTPRTDTTREGNEDTVDADVVPDEPRPSRGRPEIEPPRMEIEAPRDNKPAADGPAPAPGAPPALPVPKPTAKPAPKPAARPAIPAIPAAPQRPAPVKAPQPEAPQIEQGDTMAPRAPGQLVPRAGALPAARRTTRGHGGEFYTHGGWDRAVQGIEQRLVDLPVALEMMLHRLHAADAGRSQVMGVVALHDRITLFMQQLRTMLTEVNRREEPVLNAVEAAGGPDEIAAISYLREV